MGGFGGPPMGGWGHRPRRYRGGCCGGVFGSVVMIILFVLVLLVSLFSSVFGNARMSSQGGSVSYDEEKFQDYADSQYAAEFSGSTAYEDNLLIVFLVDEDNYSYHYIAWVGDHVATDINYMMGNEQTELGRAMSACINASSYKYSLDSNLAQVMETMTEEIQALGLESGFKCTEDHTQVQSHLTNHSALELNETTVNDALTAFTGATGIPAVIVVEDAQDVFGGTSSGNSALTVVVLAIVIVAAVVLVGNLIRRRREEEQDYDL